MTAGIITGINLIIADTITAVSLLYGRGEAFRAAGANYALSMTTDVHADRLAKPGRAGPGHLRACND